MTQLLQLHCQVTDVPYTCECCSGAGGLSETAIDLFHWFCFSNYRYVYLFLLLSNCGPDRSVMIRNVWRVGIRGETQVVAYYR